MVARALSSVSARTPNPICSLSPQTRCCAAASSPSFWRTIRATLIKYLSYSFAAALLAQSPSGPPRAIGSQHRHPISRRRERRIFARLTITESSASHRLLSTAASGPGAAEYRIWQSGRVDTVRPLTDDAALRQFRPQSNIRGVSQGLSQPCRTRSKTARGPDPDRRAARLISQEAQGSSLGVCSET